MSIQFEGKEIETTASGYLAEHEDWSRDLAAHMAKLDGIELAPAIGTSSTTCAKNFSKTTRAPPIRGRSSRP